MFDEEEQKNKINKGGSQFADVSNYLAANKPQAQRLASQVGQNVVASGNNARANLANASNAFNQNVQQATVKPNESILNQAKTDPSSFFKQQQQQGSPSVLSPKGNKKNDAFREMKYYLNNKNKQPAGQPAALPEPVQQGAIDAFAQMKNATYGGPTDLGADAGFQGAVGDAEKAAMMSDQAGNVIGQQDLLKNTAGPSSMSASALDSALLQSGGAAPILQNAALENKGLGDEFSKAQMGAADQVKTAQQTTADTAKKVQDIMAPQEGNLRQGIMDRFKGAKGKTSKMLADNPMQLASPEENQRLQALQYLMRL